MFLVIWEFITREGWEAEFERVYGPAGEWSELFKRGKGYMGTELFHDESKPRRYLTMDRWVSSEAYQTFKQEHREAYQRLDVLSEQMTEAESYLGAFLDDHGN